MARPRSFDPDHVLHAAERQFRTTGYNGTSVDDISAATGLGRAAWSRRRWPSVCERRSGDIDPDADPDDLAYLLVTIIRGIDVVGATATVPPA